jgi:hypothetical protein
MNALWGYRVKSRLYACSFNKKYQDKVHTDVSANPPSGCSKNTSTLPKLRPVFRLADKTHFLSKSAGYLSGTGLGHGLDDRWFESRQKLGIFLFTTASRLALEPTQPPIQLVPGALSHHVWHKQTYFWPAIRAF